MAYRIQYGKFPQFSTKNHFTTKKYTVAIISAITAIMILIFITIPQIKTGVLDLLLPGDAGVTGSAISAFADDLKNGVPVGEAASAFCKSIINNAELS